MAGRPMKPRVKPAELKKLRQREAERPPIREYPEPEPPRYKPLG